MRNDKRRAMNEEMKKGRIRRDRDTRREGSMREKE